MLHRAPLQPTLPMQSGLQRVNTAYMAEQSSRAAVLAAAEAVRAECLRAAVDGYERAGMSGLCEEGRWEMVVDAIKSLDVDAIVAGLPATGRTDAPGPAGAQAP